MFIFLFYIFIYFIFKMFCTIASSQFPLEEFSCHISNSFPAILLPFSLCLSLSLPLFWQLQ